MAAVTAAVVGGAGLVSGLAGARQQQDALAQSQQAADQINLGPVTSVDPFFGGGAFNRGRFTSSPGAFGDLRSEILGGMGGLFSGLSSGEIPGFLSDAAAEARGAIGAPTFQGADPAVLSGLRDTAMAQFGVLGQAPEQLGAQKTDLLRQLAAPQEQRARVGQQSNLFAQGRLGTTGGAGEMRALAEAQSQADLQRQLAGLDFGRAVQSDALGRLTSTLQQGDALTEGQFRRDLAANEASARRALERFGIAGNIFDAQRQGMQARLGTLQGGLGLLGGIQQMGLGQFGAGLEAQIARNNAAAQRAGVFSAANEFAGQGLMGFGGGLFSSIPSILGA